MKTAIHPKYVLATVTCACGHTWQTMSTKEVLKTDLCSNCHPFYTGEQRIVDTAGQVERFMRRMGNRTVTATPTATQPASAARRTRPTSRLLPRSAALAPQLRLKAKPQDADTADSEAVTAETEA